MQCGACGARVATGANFCTQCGASLSGKCARCGAALPEGARFCPGCGVELEVSSHQGRAALGGTEAPEAELRQITAVFCDLVGSTEISDRLDPEEFGELMNSYHDKAIAVLASYENEVARFVGDGIFICFGWPEAHEDDPERAIRAALDIAAEIETLEDGVPAGASLSVRVGVHTGPALVGALRGGSEREMALGKTLNVAARLQQVAPPGGVVISASTQRVVQGLFVTSDLGQQSLKGLPDPVHTFQVIQPSGVRGRLDAARGTLTPMVNRDPELGILTDLWDHVRAGRGHTMLVVGEPGVGKSRIVFEFRERVRQSRHTWLECGCSSYTRHTAFRPVLELARRGLVLRDDDEPEERLAKLRAALEQLGMGAEEDVRALANALLIPSEAGYSPPETSPAAQRRRTLELFAEWTLRLAELQPTIILVEDLHFADPSSLELFQRLIAEGARAPLLLIGTARPEFEPGWSSRPNLSRLDLKPLRDSDMRSLVTAVSGQRELPPSLVEHVVSQTEGIPLFAEEMSKTLLESRLRAPEHLEPHRPEPIDIPATLYDSLMARLDRLSAAKRVAQHVAVIGREFDYALAEEVLGLDVDVVRHGLARLVEDDLLLRRGEPPDSTYAFRHALIQDAAYRSLLKRRRRELHGRVADALERRRSGEGPAVSAEIIAQHYDCAEQPEQALRFYREAADHSAGQSAHREAAAHLTRAIELIGDLPHEGRWRAIEADLQTALGSSIIATRGYADEAIETAYERARALYEALGDRRQVGYTLAGLSLFYFNHGEVQRGAELAGEALDLAEEIEDSTLQVLARVQAAVPIFYQGEFSPALEHAERASEIYELSRDRWLGYRFGADQGVAAHCFAALALMQLGRPDSALARARSASNLADLLADPYNLAYALFFETAVHWNRGDTSAQQLCAARVVAIAEEHEFQLFIGLGRMFQTAARVFASGHQAALHELYAGSELAAATGFRGGMPAFICLVAEAQRAAGCANDALATIAAALDASTQTAQRYWDAELHRIRGELQIELGDEQDGTAELEHAIDIAREQGGTWQELRATLGLARYLSAHGSAGEARELLRPIYARFEEGFTTRELSDAADLLGELSPVSARRGHEPARTGGES
ncbi:MAG: AAA family ATPase [Solirubrobacterales bacterium]|nr:AAA family ATPase [Solirubrobacterales bacterium]